MVSYVVFFPQQAVTSRLKEVKEFACKFADRYELTDQERWWNYRNDGIVFGFEGDKGRQAANIFIDQCRLRNIRCWGEW